AGRGTRSSVPRRRTAPGSDRPSRRARWPSGSGKAPSGGSTAIGSETTLSESDAPPPGAPYGRVRTRPPATPGHPTSISLEDAFWSELRRIAGAQRRPLAELVAAIDDKRGETNLSSALRLYVLAAVKRGL